MGGKKLKYGTPNSTVLQAFFVLYTDRYPNKGMQPGMVMSLGEELTRHGLSRQMDLISCLDEGRLVSRWGRPRQRLADMPVKEQQPAQSIVLHGAAVALSPWLQDEAAVLCKWLSKGR